MTNVPEAFLALEAQLGYCTIALATDYDCWLDDPAQHASADQVLSAFRTNLVRCSSCWPTRSRNTREDDSRPCRQTLPGALATPRERMTAEQRALVGLL
jgi:5'-methylthioadenosine phosphorylase